VVDGAWAGGRAGVRNGAGRVRESASTLIGRPAERFWMPGHVRVEAVGVPVDHCCLRVV
jgi:hypothetical protein